MWFMFPNIFFIKEKQIVRSCGLRNSLILQRLTLIGWLDFLGGGFSFRLFIKVANNRSKEIEGMTLLIMIITVRHQTTFLPVQSLWLVGGKNRGWSIHKLCSPGGGLSLSDEPCVCHHHAFFWGSHGCPSLKGTLSLMSTGTITSWRQVVTEEAFMYQRVNCV